jgi:hypothetical protein
MAVIEVTAGMADTEVTAATAAMVVTATRLNPVSVRSARARRSSVRHAPHVLARCPPMNALALTPP